MSSVSWIEIKKSALAHNIAQFRKLIGAKKMLMAVVKSNAYGHGMIGVAKNVENLVDYLGVVNLDEALELKKQGIKKPVMVLSYFSDDKKIIFALKNKIEFPIYDLQTAKKLSVLAKEINQQGIAHIKIDTGTSRLGISPQKALDFIREVSQLPNLKIKGIFTHYAASEQKDQSFTEKQTQCLVKVIQELKKQNITIELAHSDCSASTIAHRGAHFNLIRLGIALYGLWPSKEIKKSFQGNLILQPVLTWKTRVIQIKNIPKGSYVGYDCTYQAKKSLKIAVLPIGYYEGYDRHLSNCGEVLIQGKKCPVIGRVCMNLIMVNASKIKNLKKGDEVVLIGRQGKEQITTEDLAKKINTINYEVVTRLNANIKRILV